MESKKNLYQILILILVIGVFLAACTSLPPESNPTNQTTTVPKESTPKIVCGQIITENTTLVENLECPSGTPSAIIVGAPNITLDLGGHVISGSVSGDLGVGVSAENVEGITIRNGTLEGFLVATDLLNVNNVTIENLTIRNLDISHPDTFIFGIGVHKCQEVVIQDCLFEFPHS